MPQVNYDYIADQLTPEERERRITNAILELERNPNASRRGVARNHGLPESTLRGRMKKLNMNYKDYNKYAHRNRMKSGDGGSLGGSGSMTGGSPSGLDAATSANLHSVPSAGHVGSYGRPSSQINMNKMGHAGGQLGGVADVPKVENPVLVMKSSDLSHDPYREYFIGLKRTREWIKAAIVMGATGQNGNASNGTRLYKRQQQQQQSQLNVVPEALIPPYRPPPMLQISSVDYHLRVERSFPTEPELDTSRELKPSVINSLPKREVPIKVTLSNLVSEQALEYTEADQILDDEDSEQGSEDEDDNEDGADEDIDEDDAAETAEVIFTEQTSNNKIRSRKIDACLDELMKMGNITSEEVKDVSRKYKISESAIRRLYSKAKKPAAEYCLSEEIEMHVLHILKSSMSNDKFYIKNLINEIITGYVKQDFYSQSGNLEEMLDEERIDEIGMDFLWKYSDEVIGTFKLQQLTVDDEKDEED